MRLRSIVLGLACLLFAVPAGAAPKPYRVSLVGDEFDGQRWHTGVLIELDEGWKTYWRMPGDSGVPPEFTWKTSAPSHVEVSFPVPTRFADASGETVGYKHQVLFPVSVEAGTAAGVRLDLDLFFAICRDVCIPARADAAIELGPLLRDADGAARVTDAIKAVPLPGSPVTAATLTMRDGKPLLELGLDGKADDIFIETDGSAYFHAPQFSADGRRAVIAVGNVDDPARLKGAALRLTLKTGATGLEQTIVLP